MAKQEEGLLDAEARVESYMPADWMPVGLDIQEATQQQWRNTFNTLIYRLHDLLHPNVFFLTWNDAPKARLLFQLAEEVCFTSLGNLERY